VKKKWYIVQTYSGLENSIKEALEVKIKSFQLEHLFGRILIPEEVKLDRSAPPAEKHLVFSGTKLKVKANQDVERGDVLATEPEIKAKSDGKVKEIKNYRVIHIETIDRKYTKSYFVPESAKLESGIKIGARIKQGMPLAHQGDYICEIDGRIFYTGKLKRVAIERNTGEEDVYMIHPDAMITEKLKRGSAIARGESLSREREIKTKVQGRVELNEMTSRTEIKVYRITKNRLYPGYIFVELIPSEETLSLVRSTPNVVNFVSVGGQPVELKPRETRALLKLAGLEEYKETTTGPVKVEVDFEVGEMVRIKSGPFEDFVGKISQLSPERHEVKVIVSIFGRETPVNLNISEIESIV